MEEVEEALMTEDLRKKRDRSEPQEGTLQIRKRHGRSLPLDAEKEEQKACRDKRGEDEVEDEKMGSESDDEDLQFSKYRERWVDIWGYLGDFEETTRTRMRFTDNGNPSKCYDSFPCTTVQVFLAKIAKINGGLQFPLSVYGVIAARDCADRRRNIIFRRERDNCQTITEGDPYLELTGPVRAIVLLDPVFIEVMLKVKGAVECEDKTLNFQAIELIESDTTRSSMIYGSYNSKLSTLELTLGSIISSVEASLTVRVLNGSFPGAFSIIARTSSSEDTDEGELLLGSFDKTLPGFSDGHITLSRSVVSVPVSGKLVISVAAFEPSKKMVESVDVVFEAKAAGVNSCPLEGSSFALAINVVWSPPLLE